MKFLRSWKFRLLFFFAVVGPGFITANVDNDANGILTYSQAGAQFGYMLLWTMIPTTIALIVVQEMCARMGAVTGKGLSDLIREEYGLRDYLPHDARHSDYKFRKRRGRVCRHCGKHGVVRRFEVLLGANLRRDRLVDCSQRPVQER